MQARSFTQLLRRRYNYFAASSACSLISGEDIWAQAAALFITIRQAFTPRGCSDYHAHAATGQRDDEYYTAFRH